MEFLILGPLEVRRDGATVAVAGAKQRTLLAILLTEPNRPFTVERIAELLWPEEAPATAAHAIEVYVSQLRKALEPEGPPYRILVRTAAGYMLRAQPTAIDAVNLQQLVEASKHLSPDDRLSELNRALALWRGPAFADFAGESFTISEAARLAELHMHALEERIDAELSLGRHDSLIGELVSLVSANPLRERLCGQLMLALYRSGRQAEASDVYQRTRDKLVDDLGMEPGPELQLLLKRILQQDPSLVYSSSPSAERSDQLRSQLLRQFERISAYGFLTPVDQLDWTTLYPPQESGVLSDSPGVPSYVQRTADQQLRNAIRNGLTATDPRRRLIVLSGESKVGKTRTLLEALGECCPSARLVWLRVPDQSDETPPLDALAASWEEAVRQSILPSTKVVVVLDDLQYHVSLRSNAISFAPILFLARQETLVVATCQPWFLRLDPAERNRALPQADPQLIRWASEQAIALAARLDAEERQRALDVFAVALQERRIGLDALERLPETLASVDQLMAKYDHAAADPRHAHRAALVDAAVDHWVLMPGFGVSVDLLIDFAHRHLKERFPTRGWQSHFTDDAIDWATEPLGQVHALLNDVANDRVPVLRLHDGVATRLAASWNPSGWISEFRERLPQIALFNVGLFLEGRGHLDGAENWYRLLSETEGTSTSARRLMAAYLM